MSRRIKCWLAAVLLVLLVATTVLWLRHAAEPTHNGWTASEWFAFSFGPKHGEAVEAMRAMGPDAVPYLRGRLRDRDTMVRRLRWTLTPKLPLTLRRRIPVPMPAARSQAQAATLLGALGTDGRAATPEMLRLLEEYLANQTTNAAAPVVMSAQTPGAPPHWNLNADFTVGSLLGALQQIGTDDARFIEPLTLLCANPLHDRSAFAVLGSEGFRAVVVSNLSIFRGFLKGDEAHQLGGMIAVASLLKEHPEMIMDFLPLLESSSARVRGQAATMLQSAEANFERIVPLLVRTLEDENATGGTHVFRAVRVLPAKETKLILFPPSFRPGISWSATQPPGPYRVRSVSHAAGQTLAVLADRSPLVIPALISALDSTNRFLQIAATDALTKIGPPASAALPALKTLAESDDRQVRYAAAYALWIIGRDAEALVPFRVEEILQHANWAAIKFVGEVRAATEPVILALMKMLDDENWRVRGRAAESLGQIGPAAAAAVPALRLASREDPHAIVRAAATDALRMINGETDEAAGM